MQLLYRQYNPEQCVYGPAGKMNCFICSATCKERAEDMIQHGFVKVEGVNGLTYYKKDE